MKKILLLASMLTLTLCLSAENIAFDSYGNVLLQNYESYADNQVVKITITISDSTDTGVGWGVGTIKPINNSSAAAAYSFQSQAVSPEGAENVYELTIAQLKEFAKVDGVYFVDQYSQSGITINCFNAAKLRSITVESAAVVSSSLNFETDDIGTVYASIAWNPNNISSIVSANPTVATEHSLHVVATNYNSFPKFSFTLPEGKTFAGIEKMTFDIHFILAEGEIESYPQNRYKALFFFIDAPATTFTVNAPTKQFDNFFGDETLNTWIPKTVTFTDAAFEQFAALNAFDIAFGINHNKIDFYLDNIVLVERTTAVEKTTDNDFFVSVVNKTLTLNKTANAIRVFDICGRLISTTQQSNSVNLSAISQGIYIVNIQNEGTERNIKFINK
ncbi:MAG: T9SS type A sorting domain-containing protein [Paludibacter sp.]|jgi:hypothetical protein|nr:T9SS type A sorting domain-containing protein [Paludibacter sp.]